VWLWFCVAALTQLFALLSPGFLLLRSIGAQRVASICLAPLLSCALLIISANLFSFFGVYCNWAVVLLPALAVCAGARLISHLRARRDSCSKNEALASLRINWKHALLYIAVGIIVGIFALLMPLGEPTNFVQEIDNKTHLAIVREFVETGNWSTLTGGFYPCGLHTIGALSVSLSGADIVVAQNALNFVFAFIVFPLAMLAFLTMLNPDENKFAFYGAFVTPGFAAFPIGIIHFGPLFANMAGFAMFPALACLFIIAIESFKLRRYRVPNVLAFILASMASIIVHPNTLFLAIAFLAPYCVQEIYNYGGARISRARKVVLCTAFLVLVFAVWCVFYKSSFMRATIDAAWPSYTDVKHALIDLAFFRMTNRCAQLVLAVLIVFGFIKALSLQRQRWLAVTYVIFGVFFFFDIATDGFLKRFLTGFWYADPCRISACLTIAAIPLATLGFTSIDKAVRKLSPKLTQTEPLGKLVSAGALAVFIFLNYGPQHAFEDYRNSEFYAFDGVRLGLYLNTRGSEVIYSEDEREFVRKALVITDDSLVLNSNDDGTLFAYGADGLNTCFRVPSVWTADAPERTEGESDEEWLIRTQLDRYAESEDVQRAVAAIEAQYVIQLDANGAIEKQRKLLGYTDKKWIGIDAIDEGTPGFELVLQEDDMKLFRIMSPSM